MKLSAKEEELFKDSTPLTVAGDALEVELKRMHVREAVDFNFNPEGLIKKACQKKIRFFGISAHQGPINAGFDYYTDNLQLDYRKRKNPV
jgi:hypothetical protein